jgi:hypothetical protein
MLEINGEGKIKVDFCVWGSTHSDDACTDGPIFEPSTAISDYIASQMSVDFYWGHMSPVAKMVDMDGDGDLDIVAAFPPEFFWIENDGGAIPGTWPRHVIKDDLTYALRWSFTVVKGSQNQNVVVAGLKDANGPHVAFFSVADGYNRFEPTYSQSCPFTPMPFTFSFADFDKDGTDDMLMSYNCHPNSHIDIFLGNEASLESGTGFLATGQHTGAVGRQSCAGDFNGDGNIDFVSGYTSNTISLSEGRIWYGDGSLSFSESQVMQYTKPWDGQLAYGLAMGQESLKCGDIDYDGIDDILRTSVDGAAYLSSEGYDCGPGQECHPTTYQNNFLVSGFLIDADGDGLLDIMGNGMVHNPLVTEDPSPNIGVTLGTLSDGTMVKCVDGDCMTQNAEGKFVNSDVTTDQLASMARPVDAGGWVPYGSNGDEAKLDGDGNLVVKSPTGVISTYHSCAN